MGSSLSYEEASEVRMPPFTFCTFVMETITGVEAFDEWDIRDLVIDAGLKIGKTFGQKQLASKSVH